MLRRAPELIVMSEAIKKSLVSIGVPESNISVIYDGEDTEFYRPQAPNDVLEREYPGTDKNLKIGLVGRIVEWKRHIDLIDAVGLLRDKSSFQVFIIGEFWSEHSHLEKALQDRINFLGLRDRVVFTGFREDIREMLACLDLIVVPSEEEPFGKIVVEAMAMAKPVIGTRSGGIPEIIQHGINGILVPVKDPASLAKAIDTVAGDKKYADTLGRNARQRVISAFSVENYVRQIEELYLQPFNRQQC